MEHLERANASIAAINAQQWDTVASFLTDDFVWTNAFGTIDKPGFIAWQKAWFAAAPDYRLTWEHQREDGETVYGTTGASGTQTQPLVLPGLPMIPATGRRFATTFDTTVRWRGGQMAAATTGAPTPDIFEQLGVQRPG
jgi:hypothetical protein